MYNSFPWIGSLINNQKLFQTMFNANRKQNTHLFAAAKETLNPQMCRGFVDAFLVRQQSLEVWSFFHPVEPDRSDLKVALMQGGDGGPVAC